MVTLVIDVDIIQDVETFLRNLNGRELLSYAICNEECGAETYEWLAERVGGSVAEEFKRLAAEKRKHALRMRELFERAYPGMKPTKFNAPPLDALPVCREMLKVEDIEKAIALALLSEAIGRDVYRKLQRMAGKEEAELFGELAEVKENAYNRLLRLYNELME
ncbi:ferritin family protein [Thermococcus sp.]|uniref:ferritin family protein n=2 Tax=Thermococcus sp. TaxID=35749 RepID=UPI00263703D1|nr:ferritin family protein [Thermococcus sp.]